MNIEIPYWHPVVVHFPIVLLLFGALMVTVYTVVGRSFWREVALLAFSLGTLGAWAAVWTGETLHHEVEGTPIVEELVEHHEEFGEWALWLGLATTLLLLGIEVWVQRTKRDTAVPLPLRLGVLVLALAAAVLVARTGHLGGLMVWGVAG